MPDVKYILTQELLELLLRKYVEEVTWNAWNLNPVNPSDFLNRFFHDRKIHEDA